MKSKRKVFIGVTLLAFLLSACQSGGNSSVIDDSHSSGGSNSEESSSESSSEESSSELSESSSEEKYFTITWKNYNGNILEIDEKVREGETPTYDGQTPIRPNDETYTYTWLGWNPSVGPAVSNQTYVATYSYEKIKTEYVIDFD